MTDDQINEAIAEAVGVQFVEHDDGLWSVNGPGASLNRGGLSREHAAYVALKYTTCLNAMVEVQSRLDPRLRERFWDECCLSFCALQYMKEDDDHWTILNLSARQRAEAFLKTIGKWTDA